MVALSIATFATFATLQFTIFGMLSGLSDVRDVSLEDDLTIFAKPTGPKRRFTQSTQLTDELARDSRLAAKLQERETSVSSSDEWAWTDNFTAFEPTEDWKNKCKTKFENLGVYENFSKPVGHALHSMSIEEFKIFFGVDLPEMNGITTMNLDLSVSDSEIILENLQSRPSVFESSGIYAYDSVLTNIHKPHWDVRGNPLEKILHRMHMHDLFSKIAAQIHKFDEVTDDICTCALDTDGNGIKGEIKNKHHFIGHRFNTPEYNAKYGIPKLKDAESYLVWKNCFLSVNCLGAVAEMHELGITQAALYMNCAIKKNQVLDKKLNYM